MAQSVICNIAQGSQGKYSHCYCCRHFGEKTLPTTCHYTGIYTGCFEVYLANATAAYNQVNSAASFGCQVAAWGPDMFLKFYLVKNNKIDYISANTEAREKN